MRDHRTARSVAVADRCALRACVCACPHRPAPPFAIAIALLPLSLGPQIQGSFIQPYAHALCCTGVAHCDSAPTVAGCDRSSLLTDCIRLALVFSCSPCIVIVVIVVSVCLESRASDHGHDEPLRRDLAEALLLQQGRETGRGLSQPRHGLHPGGTNERATMHSHADRCATRRIESGGGEGRSDDE